MCLGSWAVCVPPGGLTEMVPVAEMVGYAVWWWWPCAKKSMLDV